nr:MAG TPA: hypothetical protein [Caudoviricetes sp.]DAS41804.1 MAG TPA: hypothetical protein [Caudoviricetes sp.]
MFTNCSPLFTFVHQSKKRYLNTEYLVYSCSKFKQSNNSNLPYLNVTKLLKNNVFN